MPNLITLSIGTAVALGAAAGGVYMGRSAVAEIDPLYFTPVEEFRAAYPAYASGAGAYSSLYTSGAQPGYEDGAEWTCFNCSANLRSEKGMLAPTRTAAHFEPPSKVDAILDQIDRDIADAERRAKETVERYAYFPISAESGARAEAPAEVALAMKKEVKSLDVPRPDSLSVESGMTGGAADVQQ